MVITQPSRRKSSASRLTPLQSRGISPDGLSGRGAHLQREAIFVKRFAHAPAPPAGQADGVRR
jgi:hypothetical protein